MNARKVAWILASCLFIIGASTAFAAGGGHGDAESPWTVKVILARIVNTLVLFFVLVYFLKKPLVNFFSERKEKIRRDLDEAREQREQAERKLQEYEAKLAGMEEELEKMRVELKEAAGVESEKVIANAERMSASMVDSAKIAAEQEVRKAKIELRNEAVDLAVELAESLITEKINDEDRKKIVEDYLSKVGGAK